MTKHHPGRDEPVSLAPLDPEAALRALLAVRPDSAQPEDDQGADNAEAHRGPDGEDDPAR